MLSVGNLTPDIWFYSEQRKNAVSAVTARLRKCSSITGRLKKFFVSLRLPDQRSVPQTVIINWYPDIFPSVPIDHCVRLTSNRHLVRKWRNCGAEPHVSLYFHSTHRNNCIRLFHMNTNKYCRLSELPR